MKSFLFPYPSIPGEVGNSIQDLHIERIIRYFTGDDKKQKYIIQVLNTFENNIKNIIYRQHLFQDLYKYPKFFEYLTVAFNKLEKLYEDHRTFKLQYANIKTNYEASQALFNDLIKDYCYMITELMLVYKNLSQVMDKFNFTSVALINFKSFVNEKYINQAFEELYKLLEDIIMYSTNFEIDVTINKDLKISNCTLLLSKNNRGLFKRNPDHIVPLNATNQSIFQNIHNDSRINLFKMLEDVYFGLMNPLFDCKEELIFMEFGIKLYDVANRLKMQITYPKFAKDKLEYTNLYDLFLGIKGLEEVYKIIDVYPNSITIDENDSGRIIVGNNNTGKTVFIRSIGISQIFAQAGLFVTAEVANISIRNRILTFLSSKEISSMAGGRFEKEVSVISKIVDEVDNNSLIIMNEIFQSTSFEAGVDALYNILVYLTKKNTLWLTVTHLKEIVNKRQTFIKATKKDFKVLTTAIEGYQFLIKEL